MSSAKISVALLGASGRMGQALLSGIASSSYLALSGALVSSGSRWVGRDAADLGGAPGSGIGITDNLSVAIKGAQVAISFTLPQATTEILRVCSEARCPLVLGTTGHTPEQKALVERASRTIPIVMASNFSLGVNLLFKLAELTAKTLGDEYDAEIFEAHHRNKKDAPSGTALSIGEAVAKGRETTLAKSAVFTRHGDTGVRPRGAIGFSVLRGGDIVGDHKLTFAGPGERFEIAHQAHDRMSFALGALHAGRWLIGKEARLYSMMDVLHLG